MARHDRADPLEPPLTPNEAAAALRVSTKTVYRLIARGELPAARVGSQLRVERASLLAYLRQQLFKR